MFVQCLIKECLLTGPSSDPHSAPEAVIWGGGGGEAGERNKKPAEDVPHHVYSSSTTHLHVLAHLPPHQIKPGTHTHCAEDELYCPNAISPPKKPLKKTHTYTHTHIHTHQRSWTWMKHTKATAVWMISHHFPDIKTEQHTRKTHSMYAWSKTTKVTRRLREASLPSPSQHSAMSLVLPFFLGLFFM